jgi:hypothetical protein
LGEDRVSVGQHATESAAVDADTAEKVARTRTEGEVADRIAGVAAPGERDAEAQGGAGALALNEDNIERQVLVEGAEAEVSQTRGVLEEGRNEMDVDVGVEGADGDEDGDADSDADTDAAAGDQLFRKPILYIKGQEKPYVCPVSCLVQSRVIPSYPDHPSP